MQTSWYKRHKTAKSLGLFCSECLAEPIGQSSHSVAASDSYSFFPQMCPDNIASALGSAKFAFIHLLAITGVLSLGFNCRNICPVLIQIQPSNRCVCVCVPDEKQPRYQPYACCTFMETLIFIGIGGGNKDGSRNCCRGVKTDLRLQNRRKQIINLTFKAFKTYQVTQFPPTSLQEIWFKTYWLSLLFGIFASGEVCSRVGGCVGLHFCQISP